MASAYTPGGRRRSSVPHSTRSDQCALYSNGGKVSGRVKAVELVIEHFDRPPMRLLLAPADPKIADISEKGFHRG